MPGRSRSESWRRASEAGPAATLQGRRLLHIAGHLGHVAVGGQATELRIMGANLFQYPRLHRRPVPSPPAAAVRGPSGGRPPRRSRAPPLPADSFPPPRLCVMEVYINLVPRLDQHQLRAHALGVGHHRSCSHSRGPWPRKLAACKPSCRPSWAPRPPACPQFRTNLLLTRGK